MNITNIAIINPIVTDITRPYKLRYDKWMTEYKKWAH